MSTSIISPAGQSGNKPPARPPRQQILLVHHGDGWIEIFGDDTIDVRIVAMPWIGRHDPAAEIAGEEYVRQQLPEVYRRLYWPGMRRAAAMLTPVRPSDLVRRQWERSVLATLDRIDGRASQ